MPFGLCKPSSTFLRTMYLLLSEFPEFIGAYVDDIFVHTNNMKEHTAALRMLYMKLRKKWPSLEDPTDVNTFSGLCGFYQRFVQDNATVVAS